MPRIGVNKWSVLCEIISGVILAELANSNHSSTLGVATLGESIVLSLLKYKYRDNLHLFLLQVSTTPYSYFNVCTPPCHGVAMMAESNLKYPEVFRIHGSTIISMLLHTYQHN